MTTADWIFIPILSCYVLFPFLFSLTFGTNWSWDEGELLANGLLWGFVLAPLGVLVILLYWLFLLGGKIRTLLVGKE